MAKICSKCYSLLYIRYGMSKKGKTNHERSCQSFSFILKTDYLHLNLAVTMKVLVCENNSSGTSSLFMVTDCLGKIFTGLTSQTACLRESLKRKSPDKATGCLEKLL